MTAENVVKVGAKLTKDEATLAAGIGANLAADLEKAIAAVEGGMQKMYALMVAATQGRQANMARAILREATDALKGAGKPIGTVNQIRTILLWHVENGVEVPKKYSEARKAYESKPKKERAPRQTKGPSEGEGKGEGEGLTVVEGGVPTDERRQLLAQINAVLGTLSIDDLTNVALYIYDLRDSKRETLEAADAEAEAA